MVGREGLIAGLVELGLECPRARELVAQLSLHRGPHTIGQKSLALMGTQDETMESLEQIADSMDLPVSMTTMPCRKGSCSKGSGGTAFLLETNAYLIW